MWQVKKSTLFKRQFISFAKNYKKIADEETAVRFINEVENSINYICLYPLACKKYSDAQKHSILKKYEFRQLGLKIFPYSIFFRIKDDHILLLEAMYAHRMDTIKRLSNAEKSGEIEK